MKINFFALFFALLSFVISNAFLGQQKDYFVKFKSELTIENIESLIGLCKSCENKNITSPFTIKSGDLQRTYVFSNFTRSEIIEIEKELSKRIDYIEEVPEYSFLFTPNDYSPLLWNLDKINAEQAWDQTTGSNVLIAMVDDAVDLSHPDLMNNIWVNPNEIPGNGIDDDLNGYIDDVNGWDAADNDNDPNPPFGANNSFFSHGTHCAGIAAASTNNGVGISSIGFNSTIIPVKIAADVNGFLTGAYQGVDYAIASGAQVISMSWGGAGYSITYQNIFNFANSQGIVCVAAAGNNNSSQLFYPASYNHVISVGATDQNDLKSSFSNFGSMIDVMAPGSGIYSTVPNSNYDFKSGTSMACPLVAGLAALMISKSPNITPSELETCLKNSCEDITPLNPLYTNQLGAGRINAFAALQCLKPINAQFTADNTFQCENNQIQFFDGSDNSPNSWQWSFPGGTPSTSSAQNPIVTYATSGNYDVQLIVSNSNGSDTLNKVNYITIGQPSCTMLGNTSVLLGQSAYINISFTGTPPFSFSYTDGITTNSVSNINTNTYQLVVSPLNTTTYSLVSMQDANCAGMIFGSSQVTVVTGTGCDTINATLFKKAFISNSNHKTKSVASTSDGGAIILSTSPTGFGLDDYVVIKLDANYNIEWQKGLGSNNNEGVYQACIIQDSNDDFLIAGSYSNSNNFTAQLIKLDLNGNILWNRAFSSFGIDHYRHIVEADNGDYIVIGTSNFAISSSDFLITRFDTNGNLLLSKSIGAGGNDHPLKSLLLSNNNIMVCGSNQITSSNRAGTLTLLDSNLNIIWNKRFNPSSATIYFNDMILKQNGNVLIAANETTSSSNSIILTEVDVNGNVIWSKKYDSGLLDNLTGLVELNNSTCTISFQRINGGSQYSCLINIDGQGNIVWSKSFPNNNNNVDSQVQKLIVKDNDGNILLGGYDNFGGVDVLTLMKINQCGELGCGEQNVNINVTNLSYIPSNLVYQEVIHGGIINHNINSQNLNYTESLICDTTLSPIIISPCALNANFSFENSCLLDSIIFNDISINSIGNIIYWNWNFGDGNFMNGSSDVGHLYSNPGVYNVELIVGTDEYCFDTITQLVNVTYNPSVTISDTSICVNDSVLMLPQIHCAQEPLSYSWSPTIGLSNSTILNPLASPSSNTTYVLTVTDVHGNTFSDDVTISIDQNCCKSYPLIGVNDICLNELATISNNSITNGNASFEWNFGSQSSPSFSNQNQPPPVAFLSTASHEITLYLIDDCGLDSISTNIYVNELPYIELGSDSIVCDQTVVNLGDYPIGNLSYSWQPSGLVSDPNIPNPSAFISQNQTFYLTVQDLFTGCSNFDSVNYQVFIKDINVEAPIEVCLGDSVNIISSSSTLGLTTYFWNFGTNATPSSATSNVAPPVYYNMQGNFDAKFYVQDQCGLDSVLFNVQVNELPQAITIEDTIVCDSSTLFIGGTSQEDLIYFWSPSHLVSNPNASNPSILFTESNFIYLEVTDTITGCQNKDSVNIQFIFQNNNLIFQNDTTICHDEKIYLNAILLSNTDYFWEPNGENTQTISTDSSGYYIVNITNHCGSFSDSVLVSHTKCDCDVVFPNIFTPNSDGINDGFRILTYGICDIESIQIYNRWGQVIFYNINEFTTWDGHNMNGEMVPEGTYYYIAKVNDVNYSGHFMLLR